MLLSPTLLAMLLAAAEPVPDPLDFEQTIAEAQRLWSQGDNQAVARLFERAQQIDPRPEYQFGLARAEIAMGHCERGRALLDELIDGEPPPPILESAQQLRAECPEDPPARTDSSPAAVEPTAPSASDAGATTDGDDPTTSPEFRDGERERRTRRNHQPDALGWGLLGGGVAVGVVGTGLWLGGARRLADPPPTATEDALVPYTDRWLSVGRAGAIVTSLGVAVALVGVVRLVVRARRGNEGLARRPRMMGVGSLGHRARRVP